MGSLTFHRSTPSMTVLVHNGLGPALYIMVEPSPGDGTRTRPQGLVARDAGNR